MRTHRIKRRARRAGISLTGGIGIVLAVASLAFACTVVAQDSSTTIESITWNNPLSSTQCVGWGDCAMAGDEIAVSGSVGSTAAAKDREYMLHFLNRDGWQENQSHSCMGAAQGVVVSPGLPETNEPGPDVIIGGPAHSDASTGAIPETRGIIPALLDTTNTGGTAMVCFTEVTPNPDSVTIPYNGFTTAPDTLHIVLL